MPLEEPASLTATLTVANVAAPQLLRRITVAAAEKKWLQFRRIPLLALRVQLRSSGQSPIRMAKRPATTAMIPEESRCSLLS